MSGPMVSVDGLSVTFDAGSRPVFAVRDLSFAVAARETFGLVGESGSGKSTVLRTIAGLIDPAAGRVILDGEAVGRRRTIAQRRRLQFVFQDPYGSLHPRQTVDQILREPLAIHGISGAADEVAAALADVGLAQIHRFRYAHQLSGGQRQRVAIARALILRPPILLLDEPTSALDVSVQAEILNLLARLRRTRELTTILVSHDLPVVAHLCDRIAIMRAGRLVEILGVDALRSGAATQPYTRALIAASKGYRRDDAGVCPA